MNAVAIGDTDIWCACPRCGVYEHHLITAHPPERLGEYREVSIVDDTGRTIQTYDANARPARFERECRSCGHVWSERPTG